MQSARSLARPLSLVPEMCASEGCWEQLAPSTVPGAWQAPGFHLFSECECGGEISFVTSISVCPPSQGKKKKKSSVF